MNNIENIEILTQKLLNETPENVHSVGYGFKEVDGKLTDELSIIFGVSEKRPLSSIPENEILPFEVSSNDGNVFSTDVIQIPQLSAYYCYADSNTVEPVSLHRQSRTSYIGGIRVSMDVIGQPGTASTGTMGLICKDTTDNTLVALTNAHVGVHAPRSASAQLSSFDNKQATIYQALPWSNQSTMKLKRYVPFSDTSNTIDAAVLAITNSSRVDTLTAFKQLNLDYGNVDFATTTEINGLVSNRNPVFKAGARTGPVGWPGSSPWGSDLCSLTATQIGASVNVAFEDYTGQYTIPFTTCIIYRGTNTVASDSGDSGSAVCALINNEWKVFGLTFAGAGSNNNDISVACRIDTICSTLQLTAWDGQTTALTNLNNESVKYVLGKSSSISFTEGNKTYWQTGLTII